FFLQGSVAGSRAEVVLPEWDCVAFHLSHFGGTDATPVDPLLWGNLRCVFLLVWLPRCYNARVKAPLVRTLIICHDLLNLEARWRDSYARSTKWYFCPGNRFALLYGVRSA